MSIWLLFDFLFLGNPEILPCFFLLGYVTEKKVSWISILTVSLLFDWILFSTKYIFLLICCILKLISLLLPKTKRNPYIEYFLYYFSFLILLMISQKISFHHLFHRNILNTYLISNFFLFCFIKTNHHS